LPPIVSRNTSSNAEKPTIVPTTPRPAPPEPAVAPFSEIERQALEAKKITIDLIFTLSVPNQADRQNHRS
jgi:hypothetical protein